MKTRGIITGILLVSLLALAGVSLAKAAERQKFHRFPTTSVSEEKMQIWHKTNVKRNKQGTMQSSQILSLARSADNLYIGLLNGIAAYNVKTKNLVNFTISDGLGENLSPVMGTDNMGHVWIGGTLTLTEIDAGNIKNYAQLDVFNELITYSMFQHASGELWMITNKGLYTRTTGGRWNIQNKGLPEGLRGVAIDRSGNIWAYSNALYFFDLKRLGFENMQVREWETFLPLDSNSLTITDIEIDENNILWIGTAHRGIFTHDINTGTWNHDPFTIQAPITDIESDGKGAVWVGTRKGLYENSSGVWLRIGKENGLPEIHITSLLLDGETTWVGTSEGLYGIDNNVITFLSENGANTSAFSYTPEQQSLLKAVKSKVEIKQNKEEKARQNAINQGLGQIYTDLQMPGREWIRDAVIPLRDKGVFAESELFRPEDKVLKEELVKMAIVGAGHTIEGQPTDFTLHADVPQHNWAVPYINKAVEIGALPRARSFGFNNRVTRYEALELLFAIFKIPVENVTSTEFDDLQPGQRALVETAVKKGFVKGYSQENQLTIKAAEKYRIIDRLLTEGSGGENVKEVQKVLTDLNFYHGPINGIYEAETINAMADYQLSRGLKTPESEGFGAFDAETRIRLKEEELGTGHITGQSKLFKPDNQFTRAQMAIVLLKVMESQGR